MSEQERLEKKYYAFSEAWRIADSALLKISLTTVNDTHSAETANQARQMTQELLSKLQEELNHDDNHRAND
jgi:hypothetical protein